MKYIFISAVFSLFRSLSAQPAINVVESVDLKKYTGIWYEIARLPNTFEKNLKCVTATYTLRDDGRITVENRGVKISEPGKVSSIKGVAWLPNPSVTAKLKVRFFWPFSGNYWILALDKDYRYALVGDPSLKYLWVLGRERVMDEKIYNNLLEVARNNGYNVQPIIKVEQDCR